MKTLNIYETREKIGSAFISLVIPAIINYLIVRYLPECDSWLELQQEYSSALSALLTAVMTFVVLWIIYRIKINFPRFREFGKYEGRWLQIIPDFVSRPYSIIDFEYNKELEKYELHGINFYSDIEKGGIIFNAYRFVERSFRDGFYYITNHTSENKNGLGKLGFIKSNYDNLTRAEGYFFDSSNESMSRKYNTIMIKCDKAFFEHINKPFLSVVKSNNLSPIEIVKASKEFADNEITCYRQKHLLADELTPPHG